MMISKKLNKEINMIFDGDAVRMTQKRIMWIQAAEQRKEFIDSLRKQGLKRKMYSQQVVEYDKQNMQVFYV